LTNNAGVQNQQTQLGQNPAAGLEHGYEAPSGQGQPNPGGTPSVQPTSRTNGQRSEASPTQVPEPPVTTGAATTVPDPGTPVREAASTSGDMSAGPPTGSPILMAAAYTGGTGGGTEVTPTGGSSTTNNLVNNTTTGGSGGSETYTNPSDRGSSMPTSSVLMASANPSVAGSPTTAATFNQGVSSGAINSGNIGNQIENMNKGGPPQPPPPISYA